MKCLLLLTLIVLASWSAQALTPGEIRALEDIRTSWNSFQASTAPWPAGSLVNACTEEESDHYYGLECSKDEDPHVTGLVFSMSRLSGGLPESMGELLWLTKFYSYQARIVGTIPDIFGNLTKLEIFVIIEPGSLLPSVSELSYRTIPPSIGLATSLKKLQLQVLSLMGTVPDSLTQLSNLQELKLQSSHEMIRLSLHGTLPQNLTEMASLRSVQILHTNLAGFAPSTRPFSPRLQTLQLTDNPYFSLSASTIRLSDMKSLTLDHCPHVTGLLYMDVTANLTYLYIQDTPIMADIDDSFWSKATNLTLLHLDGNDFRGSISPFIGQMSSLKTLEMFMPLTGSIPPEIGNCTRLGTIKLNSLMLTGPLPSSLGFLPLSVLIIKNAKNLGPFPESYAQMSFFTIEISNSGLTGPLPSFRSSMLDFSNNQLTGQLPDLNCVNCKLGNNKFSGTVPCSFLRDGNSIDLSNNLLGPFLSPQCWTQRHSQMKSLDLSHNAFKCPLPSLDPLDPRIDAIDVSYNRFYGSIPASWSIVSDLNVENNQLSEQLDSFLTGFRGLHLNLANNQFVGTIPEIGHLDRLNTLNLDRNHFHGRIPRVNSSLLELTATQNRLDAVISAEFIASVRDGSLVTLDLSKNLLRCINSPELSLSTMFGSKSLKHLNLAHNDLTCDFNPFDTIWDILPLVGVPSAIVSIDLSHNKMTGTFKPQFKLPSLVILDISHNRFIGNMDLPPEIFGAITQADISDNRFTTNVALIDNLPYLFSLKASHNFFFGALRMQNMPKLETLDLSDNLLDQEPDLVSIGTLFQKDSLKMLSIKQNPGIPHMIIDSLNTGLHRSNFSSPSSVYSDVVCSSLTFYQRESISFEFDEDLFDYYQCDCDSLTFGTPPKNCRLCPSVVDLETGLGTGVDSCRGKDLKLLKNSWLVAQNTHEIVVDPSDPLSPAANRPDKALHFESESCLVMPEQILMQQSNCLGVNVTAEDLKNASTLAAALQRQCAVGSHGRLCSSCICDYEPKDPSANPVCYYEKALHCTKCSIVLKPRQYLLIIAAAVLLLIIACTIIFLIALRSKRAQKTVPWRKLSLPKRLFYRLHYLVSLGNLSILITFIQIFMELTHWDAYAIGGIVKLINLNGSSIGIICLFPFLSDPTLELISKTYVPLAALVLIGCCVGLAELLSRFFTRRFIRSALHAGGFNSGTKSPLLLSDSLNIGHDRDEDNTIGIVSDSSHRSMRSDWVSLSDDNKAEVYETLQVEYPTLALLASVSISFTRFIYFSSAIAAHEFLFSVFDRHTGVRYVQNYPSLRWDESFKARYFSFPIIVIFDFILPVGFLVLCFINRDKAKRTRNMQYYGSLFDTFSHKCYWWEMVIIFKKLSIALVLQGVPSSNVLQVTMIVTIIGGIQLIQMSLQPWRRKIENTADSVSSLILIGALLAARAGRYHNSTTSVYYVIAFAVSYVILSLVLIVWQMFNGETEYQKRIARLASENPSESDFEYDTKHPKRDTSLKPMSGDGNLDGESASDSEDSLGRTAPYSFVSGYSASPSGSTKSNY